MKEFYCYDKLYPSDTYDTFVTGIGTVPAARLTRD